MRFPLMALPLCMCSTFFLHLLEKGGEYSRYNLAVVFDDPFHVDLGQKFVRMGFFPRILIFVVMLSFGMKSIVESCKCNHIYTMKIIV